MKKIYLSLISGFLFVISWVSIGFFPFIFFAFIPLLALEAQLSKTLRFSSCYPKSIIIRSKLLEMHHLLHIYGVMVQHLHQ